MTIMVFIVVFRLYVQGGLKAVCSRNVCSRWGGLIYCTCLEYIYTLHILYKNNQKYIYICYILYNLVKKKQCTQRLPLFRESITGSFEGGDKSEIYCNTGFADRK